MKGTGLGLQDYSEGSRKGCMLSKMTAQLQVRSLAPQTASVTLSKSRSSFALMFLIFMK